MYVCVKEYEKEEKPQKAALKNSMQKWYIKEFPK